MTLYRIYTLGPDDKVADPAKEFDFSDDGEAITKAKQLLDGKALEVWKGPRLIARLEPQAKRAPPNGSGPTEDIR